MVDCNIQPEQAVSNGMWQGDNPLDFALPRLVIQLFLVLLVTRSLAWLLAPLRQPRVVAEIIGGVMLGPSVLGRFHAYSRTIFPEQSLLIIDTVANMGLLFFLFMVGLELDVKELQRTGRKAFVMAIVGVGVPFMGGMGVAKLVTETISSGVRFAPLVVFMGVPISITAFPVLVRILAEHKLLTLTEIGQLVLPAAAINDVCAWILLAMGVALAGSSTSPLTSAWVLLSGIAFVTFMLLITRRFMCCIINRANSQEVVSEIYVCITLVGVLLAGFTTDAIGIHPLFGAFVFGLIIPKDGKFAEIMTQKVEDFVTVLMLPLFFASSGLKTNLGSINSWQSVGFLVLIFVTAAGGKIGATWAFAVAQGIEKRKALALGFLMNTKGLVELIVLNIGKDSKVLNDETFAILVLMCLFTTFITTPVVMALYKPYQKAISYTARCLQDMCPGEQLRIVACIHGTQTISPILNFLEIVQSGNIKKSSKAYILHVVELCERPSCLMMAKRKAKKPGDKMFVAFETYGHLKKVTVKTKTVVSEVEHMHEDVCKVAGEKRATIIVLPFHIICGGEGDEANRAALSPLLAKLNQKVLQHAPSAVAIVADCRSRKRSSASKVGVLFMGGGHDREAIKLGCLMAEHPGTEVTIIRLLLNKEIPAQKEELLREWSLDEQCIVEVKKEIENKSIAYEERLSINDVMEAVGAIVETKKFDMYVVGRWSWCEEGELGEMMQEVVAQHMQSEYCVVMVQQYDRKVRDMDVKSTREPTYNSMA